jgi:hypothetical protein
MNGQWLCACSSTSSIGDSAWLLVLDMDDLGDYYEGCLVAYETKRALPSMFAPIRTQDKGDSFQSVVPVLTVNPRGELCPWESMQGLYPRGTPFPREATVQIKRQNNSLSVNWKGDLGPTLSGLFPKSRGDDPTAYKPLPNISNWAEFKDYVIEFDPRRYIFRGQDVQKRLRTSFHRFGRANLSRFVDEDLRTLYRHLSQRTTHIFNLNDPDHVGAFLSLAQHHGYPTPLLDWTYSPFVGAFFAYRWVKNSEARDAKNKDKKVRIFIFDQKSWLAKHQPVGRFTGRGGLNFSIVEFLAIDNERLVPQQSISSVTNIDDIETYILGMEKLEHCPYLQIVDLPFTERPSVMQELSMMGITAGSLFPGLDGACEELRERHFDL